MSVLLESDFETRTSAYRRELHVHCYRMLASYDEAEDAVQETYLRAWRGWDRFSREHVRAWLYRIATNVCVDMIRARGRQVARMRSYAEIGWLAPYPTASSTRVAPVEDEPEVVAVSKETIGSRSSRRCRCCHRASARRCSPVKSRLTGGRHGVDARDECARGQQRTPAGTVDDAQAPAVAPQRLDRAAAELGRAGAARRVYRRPRAV